jgi:hypothetical protein
LPRDGRGMEPSLMASRATAALTAGVRRKDSSERWSFLCSLPESRDRFDLLSATVYSFLCDLTLENLCIAVALHDDLA